MRKPGYSERQADLAMFIRQGGNLIILIVYVNDIELFYWNCDCLLCKRNFKKLVGVLANQSLV